MENAFYLPENPAYTIVDSARDSVRFVLERSLTTHNGLEHYATQRFSDGDGTTLLEV